jgi:hypothetical protein
MDKIISDDAERLLTEADLQEWVKMYKEEFGETLSLKDARGMATRFLDLYRVLYATPLPEKPIQELSKPEEVRPPMDLLRKVIDIVLPKKPER